MELDEAAITGFNGATSAMACRWRVWRGKMARELVLKPTAGRASPDAFVKHEHIGGEFYLV